MNRIFPSHQHAVVIGGGIAGMLAARVLADHVDQVTVFERDRFPLTPGPRRGVPQARHAHVLLVQGQRLFEQLFPGLENQLAEAGAPEAGWGEDAIWLAASDWGSRACSDMTSRTCSRDLLEWALRQRLAEYPQVTLVEDADIAGLFAGGAGMSVGGVQLRRRDARGGEAARQMVEADFVADASGRNSRTPEWLEELGLGRPEQTVENPYLGYASRWYERPADFRDRWESPGAVGEASNKPRGGVLYPIEGGRWIVTLAGASRDYPPVDGAGFVEFARSLPTPLFHAAITAARPISPIYGYQRTENRWRHFERLEHWPEGYVVLGDAACSFNPVNGQGMTAAALAATTLGRCLAEANGALEGLAAVFQRRLAKTLGQVWAL